MAEEEPSSLQHALREAETAGDPRDGFAESGQHLLNQHGDPTSSLCPLLTAWHAEGEDTYYFLSFTAKTEIYKGQHVLSLEKKPFFLDRRQIEQISS